MRGAPRGHRRRRPRTASSPGTNVPRANAAPEPMLLHRTVALALLVVAAPSSNAGAEPLQSRGGRIDTLVLTGQNRTDWRWTSTHLRELLEASGRFHVEVSLGPDGDLLDTDYVDRFDLFLVDYSGSRWGEQAEANLLAAVERGAGLVALSDSVAAFDDWKEYEELIGFRRGEYAYLDNFQEVVVSFDGPDHPIGAGQSGDLRRQDQLPVGLEYVEGEGRQILATMTGANGGPAQPAMVVSQRGKGRVFASPLGHVSNERRETWVAQRDAASERLLLRICEWAATGMVSNLKRMEPNTLTAADRAAGWKLLFDGASGEGWAHEDGVGIPREGWRVEGGALHVQPDARAEGIRTEERYDQFELELEWKVEGQGKGVLDLAGGRQLELDDANDSDRRILRPEGEWNHARVVATYDSVEHWLNGVRLLTLYDAPARWAERVGEGNLEDDPELSRMPLTQIALRNDGAAVSLRNFKIRRLPLPAEDEAPRGPQPLELFNGVDLTGWDWRPVDDVLNAPAAFRVDEEGHLVNDGLPRGLLVSAGEYQDFELDLDWRFSPVTRLPGRAELVLRATGDDPEFPDGVGIKLDHGQVGALWRHGQFELAGDRRRTNGQLLRAIRQNDARPGEWNHLEVRLQGGELVVRVNGEVVNAASGLTERAGHLQLIPLGVEVQFRGFALQPLGT